MTDTHLAPSPVPSKRPRHVEQFVSNNIDDSKVASSLVDAEEEACLSQAVSITPQIFT